MDSRQAGADARLGEEKVAEGVCVSIRELLLPRDGQQVRAVGGEADGGSRWASAAVCLQLLL